MKRAILLLSALLMSLSFIDIRDDVRMRCEALNGAVARAWQPAFIDRQIQNAYEAVYNRVVRLNESYFSTSKWIDFKANVQEYELGAEVLHPIQVRLDVGGGKFRKLRIGDRLNKDRPRYFGYWASPQVTDYDPAFGLGGTGIAECYFDGSRIGFSWPPTSDQTKAVLVEFVPRAPSIGVVAYVANPATGPGRIERDTTDTSATVYSSSKWTATATYVLLTPPSSTTRSFDSTPGHFKWGEVGLSFSQTPAGQGRMSAIFALGNPSASTSGNDMDFSGGGYVAFSIYIADQNSLDILSATAAGGSQHYISFYSYYAGVSGYASTLDDVTGSNMLDLTKLTAGMNVIYVRKSSMYQTAGAPINWKHINAVAIVLGGGDSTFVGKAASYTTDGVGTISLPPGQTDPVYYNPAQGWEKGPVADADSVAFPELGEWTVLETVCRLIPTVPGPGGSQMLNPMFKLRDEVKDNVTKMLSTRQLQQLERVGEVRRW